MPNKSQVADAMRTKIGLHNPDINPNWTPNMRARIYQCATCNHQHTTTTNHTGTCYPTCQGKCRQISLPHTKHERVLPKQTLHFYIKDA